MSSVTQDGADSPTARRRPVPTTLDGRPEPQLLRGTVTFLFTDVEGSTRLVQALRDRYPAVLAEHERVLRDAFAEHGGRVIDTQGDSFFVAFSRAREALEAAVAAQRALATHEWPEGGQIQVRMGVHTGEPVVGDGRYTGLGVHRAARVCAVAHGGQVLLSSATRELVEDELPEGVELVDLGEQLLKDLPRPERVFQLVAPGLRRAFPPLRTGVRDAPGHAPAGQFDFRLLGSLEALDGHGAQLPLGGPRQRAVLALLLLEEGRVVPTEVIVDRLWGEHPPRTAVTSLQNTISKLRKLLGAERLVTKASGYSLEVEPGELDLARFEGLTAEAGELEPGPRAELLRRALDLWRGPPLADFRYEEWAQGEIGRLDELRSSVLEDRIDAELEAGRHSELVGELESLVAAFPLRERLRGQLMLALYRSGRQAEALEAYGETRKVLVEELGIEPSRRLQELSRQILRQEGALEPAPSATPLTSHYDEVLHALEGGRLVPVLGSHGLAADAADIAEHLADCFDCPVDGRAELARVSQYVAVTRGSGPLYDELHALLDVDAEPEPVHVLLARLPAYLRERGGPQPLIVTSGYDLALEQAFRSAGETFDVVSYVAAGPHRGKFLHISPDGSSRPIEVANTYAELRPDKRAVILRVHGRVDRRPERDRESFVVSEDDYIDYLAQTDVANLVPVTVAAKLRRSHFLFLGYPPYEWNLRVFLRRVWGGQRFSYRSWAVEPGPDPLAREFWRHVDVELLDVRLEEYVRGLDERLQSGAAR